MVRCTVNESRPLADKPILDHFSSTIGDNVKPAVSVVIPTYRRASLLRRAIASVKEQTLCDWEVVVSCDDPTDMETLAYLSLEAQKDARIRFVVNRGCRGQAANLNNCLRLARGHWIKPLFDDDRLLANCLEVFHRIVQRFPSVVLAGCLAKRFRSGRLARVDRASPRAFVEIVKQKHAHLAMYLQDFECGSMPTQMLIRADVVAAGAVMPDDERLVSGIDQLWFADILRHGDRLHLSAVLVEEHQGDHETVTSLSRCEDLDNDSILIREYLEPLIPIQLTPPPLEEVKQMVYGVRGLHRLTQFKVREGTRLLKRVKSWNAAKLVAGWVGRKAFPGRFSVTPRERYYE